MKRWLAAFVVAHMLVFPAWTQTSAAQAEEEEFEPPEEDEALRPKEYGFNPLQAEQEMKVGGFYAKKGSWRAAALRFEEATRWNPMLAEAWRRLGEAREKMADRDGAAAAYKQFLELDPANKQARNVQKKLTDLAKAGGARPDKHDK